MRNFEDVDGEIVRVDGKTLYFQRVGCDISHDVGLPPGLMQWSHIVCISDDDKEYAIVLHFHTGIYTFHFFDADSDGNGATLRGLKDEETDSLIEKALDEVLERE